MDTFTHGELLKIKVEIISIVQISSDSKLYTFSLLSPEHRIGLKPGQHIAIQVMKISPQDPEGRKIKRKYTPTSSINAKGFFEIPIKVYYPTDDYPGGQLTTVIDKMNPGDCVEIMGPIGKYVYEGNGLCRMRKERTEKRFKKFGFIAGGSGITPCFQYIQYIIEQGEEIELALIYANKTESDIWLKEKLDHYQSIGKLKLLYTIGEAGEGWKGAVGRVNAEMIRECMPLPSDDTVVFFCGPSPMNRMLRELLPSLGYSNYIKF